MEVCVGVCVAKRRECGGMRGRVCEACSEEKGVWMYVWACVCVKRVLVAYCVVLIFFL